MTRSKFNGEMAMANGARMGARILSSLIQLYRWTLSPALVFLFGANSGCRFTPTCSQYAMEAIERHGALTGSALALKRLCRCHPYGECGHDPVPDTQVKGFIFHG
jgi:putative membrane protein insertion efficiency factor